MLKIALVGCGKHMRTTLVPYLHQLDGYEVDVCVDIDENAARTLQRVTHARGIATSIEQVDTSRLDAAVLALPTHAAYLVAYYLIQQRVPCFVEKPPANTTAEIEALSQLADTMGVYVQVGFNFRFAEAVVAFHNYGKDYRDTPCTANIEFRSKHPSGPEWGIDDPVEAWLYHNGVHAIDLLLWTLGDVRQVDAHILRNAEGKFTIVALIEHENTSVSTVKMGNLTNKFDIRVDLSTPDAGQFSMPHLGEVSMPVRDGKIAGEILYRTSNLDNGWSRAGYGPELQYFLENCRYSISSFPSLTDALRASRLCDAIMSRVRAEAMRL